MNADELKALQTPFKEKYKSDPESAKSTLSATGNVDLDLITCEIVHETPPFSLAGLHPMAGGDGKSACAAEMMLEALVCCAGVTLGAVCTAMGLSIQSAQLTAEGDLDFRGTLGVSRETAIGFETVRLIFTFESEEPDAKLDKAVQLAERYCVVAQTLKSVEASWSRS